MTQVELNTGDNFPEIGFGTWRISPNNRATQIVGLALEAGYRLIDTARIYENEVGVGEAIRRSQIPREDLRITTKLWNEDQGYDKTLQACQQSLQRLGLDHVDLYLIHWPATSRRHDSWRALVELYQRGLIKAAGVSNYTIEHLEELLGGSDLTPAVNQIEFHPFIYREQKPLLDYCRDKGIVIEAYSPLRRLNKSSSSVLSGISERHKKSEAQIVLRWCIQHGTIPLPRSGDPIHIKQNLQIDDFELSEEEMSDLNNISDGQRVTWDPAGMGR